MNLKYAKACDYIGRTSSLLEDGGGGGGFLYHPLNAPFLGILNAKESLLGSCELWLFVIKAQPTLYTTGPHSSVLLQREKTKHYNPQRPESTSLESDGQRSTASSIWCPAASSLSIHPEWVGFQSSFAFSARFSDSF